MTRGRGYDRAWLRLIDVLSQPKFLVSRQDFMELCETYYFYVATKIGLEQGFYVTTELGQDQECLCCDRVFLCRNKFWLGPVFPCHDRMERLYVATGLFDVETKCGQRERFGVATGNFIL